MKIYVYPSDLGGCGYYRLIWPAKILQAAGHDVKLIHPKQSAKLSGGTDNDGNLVQISAPHDADVMVFQRVTSKKMINGIKILRDHGIAVVMDVDDDMSAIHQYNPAWAALHPKSMGRNAEYDWNTAREICAASTYVTVSTDALYRRYVKNDAGMVLHNYVSEILLDIPHDPEPGTIGWGGSMHSHPDDPQVVGSSMARLARGGYRFKIVGPPRGTREAFMLEADPPATGPVAIENYPHALTKLGVGIAPLNDTRFNEAKSWLKMLEYAALGVPCIGSPRAEYRRIHALGVGLLADSPKDWYRHAKALLDNESRRNELAEAGRAAVRQLTIERNAWRWLEAWTNAFAIERGPLGTGRKNPAVGSVSAEVQK